MLTWRELVGLVLIGENSLKGLKYQYHSGVIGKKRERRR
jgi:hypothetical protein